MRKIVTTEKAPPAIGPYSQAVDTGSLVFTSGQIPLDPDSGDVVEGGIEAQTNQTFDNLVAVLEAAGLGLADVVQATVYLKSLDDFGKVNELYTERFGDQDPPARVCVEVSKLPKDVMIEISAVAARN